MALTDGTLGAMLQGVSQQPAYLRPSGKVTEQINFTSDVVQGLTSRPALRENGYLRDYPVDALNFKSFEVDGQHFILGYKAGTLVIWDTNGVEYSVAEGLAGDLNYIGDDIALYSYEGSVYITNRNTDVQISTDKTEGLANVILGGSFVTILGGKFSRKYKVVVTYADGTSYTSSYTTPDGDTNGDAAKASAGYIATKLNDALVSGGNVDMEVLKIDNTIYINNSAGPVQVRVDDDDNQTAMRAISLGTAEKVEDLPKYAKHGTLVRVENNDAGEADDFYVRFNANDIDTVGDGWGEQGVWEEWFNPEEDYQFDTSTMPHVLQKQEGSGFDFGQANWRARAVGDEETNPFLDFVGHPIRDINGFQSRLVFVAGPWVAMSQTNDPLDFWKKSATTELVTDALSFASTNENTKSIDWIVPFDQDLILMTDPGQGQFLIKGGSKLTPANAAIVKTTSYEMQGGAKPVETGRTIMFPFLSGKFSGVKEFFTNDTVATHAADTLTETLDRYISGTVTRMVCSTNHNMAALKTNDPNTQNTIWVYKYLWNDAEKVQSSWSKWIMPAKVEDFFFNGSELVVVMSEPGNVSGTTYMINALDLDIPVNETAGYHICLDRQLTKAADSSFQVRLPYANAEFVQGTGCRTPGRPVAADLVLGPDGAGEWTYTFAADTVPDGAELFCGLAYDRSLKPTMPFVRDQNGNVRARQAIVVGMFTIEYEQTGYFKAIMTSRYRVDPIEFITDWFPTEDDPDDTGAGLRDGRHPVPWGERSDYSELEITSRDPRPTTILELEYTGQTFRGN